MTREQKRQAFVLGLSAEHRAYIESKVGIPCRGWRKDDIAQAIARKARAEGLYAKSTVDVDILCAVRNTAGQLRPKERMNRYETLNKLDPPVVRWGWWDEKPCRVELLEAILMDGASTPINLVRDTAGRRFCADAATVYPHKTEAEAYEWRIREAMAMEQYVRQQIEDLKCDLLEEMTKREQFEEKWKTLTATT
ncbi:MAG: hypothetical protein E6R03_04575 [Hyphomicrobiaceae bacterium]|nr:MAG: hypothetical protein E6R03_04575 [Hyphomicrobiaceae bacterium]